MQRSLCPRAAAFVAVAALVVVTCSCAEGAADPGPPRDNCKLRDCGPLSGGDTDALDTDLEDTFDPVDTGGGDSSLLDSGKPSDSTTDTVAIDTGAIDTGTLDTGTPDTGIIDTGCKPPAGKVCSTIPQCGCKATENCDVTAVDGTTSCVSAGTIAENAKCAALGVCQKGLTCIGGLCRAFCSTTTDCGGKGTCQPVQGGTPPADIPGFKVCFSTCDPRSPATACGTQGCGFITATETGCVEAGTGTTAGSCGSATSYCAAGYGCVGTGDCHKWCRVGTAGDCPTGKTCGGITVGGTAAKYGTYSYGVCSY